MALSDEVVGEFGKILTFLNGNASRIPLGAFWLVRTWIRRRIGALGGGAASWPLVGGGDGCPLVEEWILETGFTGVRTASLVELSEFWELVVEDI